MRTTCVMSSGESGSPSTEPTCTSCTTSMSPLQTTRTSPWLLSSPWTGKQTSPQPPHSPLAAALHPVEWRRERWPHRLRMLKPDKIGLMSHPLSSTENQGLLSPDGAGCLWGWRIDSKKIELYSHYLKERGSVLQGNTRTGPTVAAGKQLFVFLIYVLMQASFLEPLSGSTDVIPALMWRMVCCTDSQPWLGTNWITWGTFKTNSWSGSIANQLSKNLCGVETLNCFEFAMCSQHWENGTSDIKTVNNQVKWL